MSQHTSAYVSIFAETFRLDRFGDNRALPLTLLETCSPLCPAPDDEETTLDQALSSFKALLLKDDNIQRGMQRGARCMQ